MSRLPRAALARVRDRVSPDGRVLSARTMHGGVSSSVHLVRLQAADGTRAAVVVRRYGEYWQRTDPAACEREYRLLEILSRSSDLPVPKPLLLDSEGGAFGAPSVVMTRLPGRPLLRPRNLTDYLDQTASLLVRLHATPIDELAFLPDQRTTVERALSTERAPRDDRLQQDVWAAAQSLWKRVAGRPVNRRLVHGDYWPGNLLWRHGQLVGLIDWEQPRLGDPVRDVATCRGDLTVLFGPEAGYQFTQRYVAAGGAPLSDLAFYDLLICTWALREMEDWAAVYPR